MTWKLLLVLLPGVLTESPPKVLECACAVDELMGVHTTLYNAGSPEWTAEVAIVKNECPELSFLDNFINKTITNPVVLPTTPPVISPTVTVEQKSPKQELWRTLPLASDYETFHGLNSSYKFHDISDTWENARRQCEKEGAHLAIVNSEYESGVLQELFKRYKNIKNMRYNDFAFIGFHDLYDEGNYVTIFGEPIAATGFTRTWAKYDNVGQSSIHPGQDCGAFHKQTGGLNDITCDHKQAYICEREADHYPPSSREIDYSSGAYDGVEMEVKPPKGTVLRTRPSPGYEYFPGVGFYRFHTKSDTWENARRICKAEGGHLAIINSQSEHQVLLDIFKRNPVLQNVQYNAYAFIGFHDQYQEGNYVTIYDEPITTTGFYKWAPGEPNNVGGNHIHAGEDCGAIYRHGGFDDLPCNMYHAFFCEQELYM